MRFDDMDAFKDIVAAVDKLNPDEQHKLYKYLKQKQQSTWWVISSDNLQAIDKTLSAVQQEAESMSDDEINALIDEAISQI